MLADWSGQTLGHFHILSKLGEGGMGAVFLAKDLKLERQVALKFLRLQEAGTAMLPDRFRTEARAAAALKHPHICTIYGVEEWEGQRVIEMEFVEGETLASRLTRGAVPLEEALDLTVQIAGALGEAHRLCIVHRDLKPANIMLTKFGAKVLDFGLAKMQRRVAAPPGAAAEAGVETLTLAATQEGTILGTPHYMSPEQARGEESDSRADLFSLGVVFYEMVTGA
jgi:serine/threonine protein kinase